MAAADNQARRNGLVSMRPPASTDTASKHASGTKALIATAPAARTTGGNSRSTKAPATSEVHTGARRKGTSKTADKGMARGRGTVTPPAAANKSRACIHNDQTPATANKEIVSVSDNIFRPATTTPGETEKQLAHRNRPTPQMGFAQTCNQQTKLGRSTGARKPTTKTRAAPSSRVVAFSEHAPRGHRNIRRIHMLSRKFLLSSGCGAHAGAKRKAPGPKEKRAEIQIGGRDNGPAQAATGNLPFGALCDSGAGAHDNPAGFGGDARLALPPSRWHPMGDVKPGTEGGEPRALRPQVPCGGMGGSTAWAGRTPRATQRRPAASGRAHGPTPPAQQQPLLRVGQRVAPSPPALLRLHLQVDFLGPFAVLPRHGYAEEQNPLGCKMQNASPCLRARPGSVAAAGNLRTAFSQDGVAYARSVGSINHRGLLAVLVLTMVMRAVVILRVVLGAVVVLVLFVLVHVLVALVRVVMTVVLGVVVRVALAVIVAQ